MKKYRNEWKYLCNISELEIINSKIKDVLPKDTHSNNDGMYVIHNLYFDDYKNMLAKMTEAGDAERYKWRIRYYGNDINYLRLELKEKLYGRGHKETCLLTRREYDYILKGDANKLFWYTDKKLLKRFCVDMMNRCFKPKCIIEYERVAYVDEVLNVRITFDKNISSSYEFDKFLDGNYIKYPIQNKGIFIVEVKFDDILPRHIKNLIERECKEQIAFSKYYNGLKALEVLK